MNKVRRKVNQCPDCYRVGITSITYKNTYYCEHCLDYFGQESREANGYSLNEEEKYD